MTTPNQLAFIGLGVMGLPMAGHLLDAGYPLYVYTRTREKAMQLVHHGAKMAASPAEAVAKANVVFLCLPDTPDVEGVVLGPSGILEAARPGLIVVDHSTISPSVTRQLAAALEKRGVKLLDAPVSGGDVGAHNATLSIMVGGDQAAFEAVEPLLRVMGKTIVHCGPSGCGQLTKLVNQILVSVTNMAVCEALAFARKHGLDETRTIEALSGGAAGSWQLANLGPKMVEGDFRPGFAIQLQQKDLRLVLQAADESKLSLPAVSLVHQLFTTAEAAGHGRNGTQALFTVVETLSALH